MNSVEENFPGLYKAAGNVAAKAQFKYFCSLGAYLGLLVLAAFVSFQWPYESSGALASATLFLLTLSILIFLRVSKPDDTWYTGRAVAESVKTRSWRWVMGAEPYQTFKEFTIVSKEFISDLRAIKNVNKVFSDGLGIEADISAPISQEMQKLRALCTVERLEYYKDHRIQDQANWYQAKAVFNKKRARFWFIASVVLNAAAILLLLFKISHPTIDLPIEVIATAAGAALTWLQAKKHNELVSSYTLTAHEIVLIKGEALAVKTEDELSEFVINSEAAFSREHTQWVARKID